MLQVPKLTIIMPVYNTAEYLPRAFDALLAQKNKAFKLVIVDDGSTDNSVEVAEKYQSLFPYFKIIKKKNGGPSDARNVGIKELDTPYVTFHDGDDWVDPSYTAFFIDAFEKHPDVNIVSCGYWLSYPDKKERVVGHTEGGFLTKSQTYLKLTNVFNSPMKGYCWNKAYRTSVIKKFNLKFDKDISLLEDQIFNVKYISVAPGVYYTQTPYYHYCQRKGSIIHQPNIKKVVDNFRGNYRVWRIIIKSLMKDREEEKRIKKFNRVLQEQSTSKESI